MDDSGRIDPEPVEGGLCRESCGTTDPVGKVGIGLTVIWLGITILSRHRLDPWWAYMLSGFGVIFVLEALFRMVRPEYRCPVGGKFVGGVALIILGSLFIAGFAEWWAMVLVVIGAVFILQGVRAAMRR